MLNRNIRARGICLSDRNNIIKDFIFNTFGQILADIFNAIWRHYKSRSNPINIINIIEKLINCDNIIRNICKSNQNKRIFKMINEWLTGLQKTPIERIRDVLYNIEQFKSDALLLPDIKQPMDKSGKGDVSGPIYGAGAKSAGSIAGGPDSTSKGATKALNQARTLTGKNPFAILKASAIASTSKAVFPNNFQNLPKVSPPFLDPLEQSDKPIYTLVLDLDETLIHNVEVSNHTFCMS